MTGYEGKKIRSLWGIIRAMLFGRVIVLVSRSGDLYRFFWFFREGR